MKMTQYILLLTLLFGINLYAGSEKLINKVNYETFYEKALEKAKSVNKPIMMVIGQSECPWCNKFYVKTLTKKSIDKEVQANFIPLTLLRDKDVFPQRFRPEGVPTVLFIEPKEQTAYYKSFGYKSKREYKIELQKAIEIFNKN